MAEYLVQESTLASLANAVRTLTGESEQMTIEQMIASIEAGGGMELTTITGSITPESDTNTITIAHGLGKVPCYFSLKINNLTSGWAAAPTSTTAKRYIPLVIYFNGETCIVYSVKSGSVTQVNHRVVDNATTVDENNITFTIPNESGMTLYCNFYGTKNYQWEAQG